MLIRSAGSMLLRCSTSVTSSEVPSRISSRSSASTWIAPRTARTAKMSPQHVEWSIPHRVATISPTTRRRIDHSAGVLGGGDALGQRVQAGDLVTGQRTERAGLLPAQLYRTD